MGYPSGERRAESTAVYTAGVRRTLLLLATLLSTQTVRAEALEPLQVDRIIESLQYFPYLYPFDEKKVRQGAEQGIDGLIRALGSPDVRFSPRNVLVPSANPQKGTTFGLEFEQDGAAQQGVQLAAIPPFTSAWYQGLQPGDIIEGIGDHDVRSVTRRAAAALLPLLEDQFVDLTVRRGETRQVVRVTRQAITPTLTVREGLPTSTAYLAMPTLFTGLSDVTDQLTRAIQVLQEDGIATLILDLRGNTGGTLNTAVAVADQFLSQGDIVSLKGKSGDTRIYGSAKPHFRDFTGRVIVLVNRETSGAAEVIASALQHARMTVIGERTAGQGVASTSHGMDVGYLTFPIAFLVTPGGQIQGVGVTPDIVVRDDRQRPAAGTVVNLPGDPVLRRALEEIGRMSQSSAPGTLGN